MKEYLLKKIVKFSWILPFTFFFLLVIENLVSQTSFNQNIQNPVIYYNGAIFTLEKDNSNKEIIEQALRTENGKITHLGTNTNILKLKSSKTTLIDLNGKSVFPAFVSMDIDEELIMNEIFLQMKKLKKDGYWKASNEKLNLFLDAFRTLTIKQAKLDNVDKILGTIQVGKFANFIILDKNPLLYNPSKITDIKVYKTINEGR